MKVHEKLYAVQQQLKAPKGQRNDFGKYNYRSCEDIVEAVKPLMAVQRLLLTLSDDLVMVGSRYYIKATAKVTDITDGESVEVTAFAREEESKKGMDGSQVTGASSSYARKYALNGLFAIDDTKDSDATNTHGKDLVCADCGRTITDGKRKDGTAWPSDEIARWSTRRYGRCLCVECSKAEEAKR